MSSACPRWSDFPSPSFLLPSAAVPEDARSEGAFRKASEHKQGPEVPGEAGRVEGYGVRTAPHTPKDPAPRAAEAASVGGREGQTSWPLIPVLPDFTVITRKTTGL